MVSQERKKVWGVDTALSLQHSDSIEADALIDSFAKQRLWLKIEDSLREAESEGERELEKGGPKWQLVGSVFKDSDER